MATLLGKAWGKRVYGSKPQKKCTTTKLHSPLTLLTFFMQKRTFLIFSPFQCSFFFNANLTPAWKRQRPMENREAEPRKDLTTSEIATVSSSLETQTASKLRLQVSGLMRKLKRHRHESMKNFQLTL